MMAEHDDAMRVWELIDKIGFCMLTTRSSDDLRARPMSAYTAQIENAIYFLTDVSSHKDDEIVRWPNVCLAFADTKDKNMFPCQAQPKCRTTATRSGNYGRRRQRRGGTILLTPPSASSRLPLLRQNIGTARAPSSAISRWRPPRSRTANPIWATMPRSNSDAEIRFADDGP